MSESQTTMLVENVKVFDGVSADLIEGNVVVSGTKIAEISDASPTITDDVQVFDGDGRVLMPGLTDAHCHVMLMCHSLEEMTTADLGSVYANTVAAANRTLMRGFTTVRDTGGPMIGIQQAIDQGVIPGPRIYPSGAMISQTSGHGDFSMVYDVATALGGVRPRGENVGLSLVADGHDRVLAATREQLKKGATQIKLMIGGGVTSPYDPLETIQFTPDEIRAAVQTASDYGTYVLAHVYNVEGIQRGIDAGVRSIEHGHLADEDTVRFMAGKDVWLSTQPFVADDHHFDDARAQAKHEQVSAGTENLYEWSKKYGVKTAFGTDILFEPDKEFHQIVMFARLSEFMEPIEALRMATSVNAELFRMCGVRDPYGGAPLGVIQPGAWADFLIVDGDPTTDLSLFNDPDANIRVIVKDGIAHKNTL
jgi:imidazolonepropionase-like amidohydrolase